MATTDRLREQWPWNAGFLRLMLFVPSALGLVATLASLPFAGLHALWWLSAIATGALLYAVYGAVGRKVGALKQQAEGEAGECCEALIVIGNLQSPGIAILQEKTLQLRPIVGSELTIKLNELQQVQEAQWLPGKFVWGKKAFHLETISGQRLAFAVPESVGERWSPRIDPRK